MNIRKGINMTYTSIHDVKRGDNIRLVSNKRRGKIIEVFTSQWQVLVKLKEGLTICDLPQIKKEEK